MNPFIGMSRWAIDCYIEQKKGLLHGSRTFDASCKSYILYADKKNAITRQKRNLDRRSYCLWSPPISWRTILIWESCIRVFRHTTKYWGMQIEVYVRNNKSIMTASRHSSRLCSTRAHLTLCQLTTPRGLWNRLFGFRVSLSFQCPIICFSRQIRDSLKLLSNLTIVLIEKSLTKLKKLFGNTKTRI